MTTKGECGCKIVEKVLPNSAIYREIVFCSKHEACDQMYEALKRIIVKGLTSSAKRDGEIALAKAEGRE